MVTYTLFWQLFPSFTGCIHPQAVQESLEFAAAVDYHKHSIEGNHIWFRRKRSDISLEAMFPGGFSINSPVGRTDIA
jgi:hypothetical protein